MRWLQFKLFLQKEAYRLMYRVQMWMFLRNDKRRSR